jgi:TatD family-associated radical SAM protein
LDLADVYAYAYGDNLYINLTNRCPNSCVFCLRNDREGVGGHKLWLTKEPSAQDVIGQMGDLRKYNEVVICGFGEPMERLDVLLEVAAYAKANGKKVRVDTCGLANLMYGCDVTPQLEALVDTVSISLNASDSKTYDSLCKSMYGEAAFDALLDFTVKAKAHVPDVMFTVVDSIGEEEIEKAKKIAEQCGVRLRIRTYIKPEDDE